MTINILNPIRIKQLMGLLWPAEREMAVSSRWLLQRSSTLDQAFTKSASVKSNVIANDSISDLRIVTINGEDYVWPTNADTNALLRIVSELTNPTHPHHYLYGETQIRSGDVVMDIGACEGSFSACAAQLGAEVVAIEPSKLMIRTIDALFERRGLRKPTILRTLLGPEARDLHFTDNPSNPGASRIASQPEPDSYLVPVITLDNIVDTLDLKKLDYIKCDAEGADVEILKSGAGTLKKFHPKIAITTYHDSDDYSELFSFLKGFGYKIKGKGLLYTNGDFRVLMLHAW